MPAGQSQCKTPVFCNKEMSFAMKNCISSSFCTLKEMECFRASDHGSRTFITSWALSESYIDQAGSTGIYHKTAKEHLRWSPSRTRWCFDAQRTVDIVNRVKQGQFSQRQICCRRASAPISTLINGHMGAPVRQADGGPKSQRSLPDGLSYKVQAIKGWLAASKPQSRLA